MGEQLLELAIATTGGRSLWRDLRGLQIDISIGGPIWAIKGWPPGATFDQVITLDTVKEHIVFRPFTRPDQQMVFDAAADGVSMHTLGGEPVATLSPARASFKGMLRSSAWDALRLGYFLGYADWNYFTTPFLFSYPGVLVRHSHDCTLECHRLPGPTARGGVARYLPRSPRALRGPRPRGRHGSLLPDDFLAGHPGTG